MILLIIIFIIYVFNSRIVIIITTKTIILCLSIINWILIIPMILIEIIRIQFSNSPNIKTKILICYIIVWNIIITFVSQLVQAWRNHFFSLGFLNISSEWSEKKLRYSPVVQLKFLYTCDKFRFTKETYTRYGITQNGIAYGALFKDLKHLTQLSMEWQSSCYKKASQGIGPYDGKLIIIYLSKFAN